MMIPLEPLLALAGGLVVLLRQQGLQYVAAAYLFWIAFEGLWPLLRLRLSEIGFV